MTVKDALHKEEELRDLYQIVCDAMANSSGDKVIIPKSVAEDIVRAILDLQDCYWHAEIKKVAA